MGTIAENADQVARCGQPRLPEWIANERLGLSGLHGMKQGLRQSGLHTVCEEARCPNRNRCFAHGTATFLLMGGTCTRACGFCSVACGEPSELDITEPQRVAGRVAAMGLKYAVLTSVTRDDLPDGGAAHFAAAIQAIKKIGTQVEALVPDFQGDLEAVATVASAGPAVFNHNLETVPELYPQVRPAADYERSLKVLSEAKRIGLASNGYDFRTKSGLMLGMGETEAQLMRVFKDLALAGVDILTMGQYLRPTKRQLPVYEYVHPSRFDELAEIAMGLGIATVYSGPLVRSSFNAEEVAKM
jgi:lipoic acid synthetase